MSLQFLRQIKGYIFKKEAAPISYSSTQEGAIYNNNNTDMRIQINGADRAIVSDTQTQTLTNKTLTSPVINTPTGIVKGDVGLGNVDNTSDATKNAAAVTLTNHTIDGDDNTIQDLALSSLKTNLTDASKFLNRDASGIVISSAKAIPSGVVVGTTDSQTITNKTVVVASNTITTAASGNLAATELNAALSELQTDIDGRQASGNYITALTSDVTASGPGSAAATIANDAVTNAKAANMATQTIKGRTTAGTGDPEDLSATQATAILNNMVGDSGSGGTKGLVPAPSAGDAAAAKFLKADGSWAVPSGGGSGGLTTSTVTSNTTMSVSNAYITNSASLLEMTLPATSSVGDVIRIVGRGTGKFKIVTNASASTQLIHRDALTSNSSSSNATDVLLATNQYSCVDLECSVANSEWTVINDISTTLVSDTNWWGTGADGNVTISSNTQLAATTDGDMIVKNYNDLTINSGVSLTTDNRCRGLLLYVKGNLNVQGNLSVTARGCKANPSTVGTDGNTPVAATDGNAVPSTGIQIRRKKSGQTSSNSVTTLFYGCGNAAVNSEANQGVLVSNGQVWTISRTGAAGAGANSGASGGGNTQGSAGSTGTGLSGGGGSGAHYAAAGGSSGAGGAGTCFSGGCGSGASSSEGSGASTSAGSSFGGAGSNAAQGAGATPAADGGGAGNPGGTGAIKLSGTTTENGQDGTGGTLIIIVRGSVTIGGSAVIEAKGSRGGNVTGTSGVTISDGGGGSGGGNIVMLYGGSLSNSGTITAAGGAGGTSNVTVNSGPGGAGGAGSIQGPTVIDL